MRHGIIRWGKRRRRPRAAIAAVAGCLVSGPALAEDAAVRAVLFGSLDAGSSAFTSIGIKAAPERVDREGIALLAVVGGGLRLERQAGVPVQTRLRSTGLASALAGYQMVFDWGVLGLFAGPEGSLETVIGVDGVGPIRTRVGARLQGELWARPSETTLTTATLVLGSARWDAYGRVSAGYRVLGAYLGPEAAAYADRTGYGKWSLGLHATDFGFGAVRCRLSGGVSYENETRRVGPYVSVTGWMPL